MTVPGLLMNLSIAPSPASTSTRTLKPSHTSALKRVPEARTPTSTRTLKPSRKCVEERTSRCRHVSPHVSPHVTLALAASLSLKREDKRGAGDTPSRAQPVSPVKPAGEKKESYRRRTMRGCQKKNPIVGVRCGDAKISACLPRGFSLGISLGFRD